ncbi:MAG TPA: hypothetical protein VG937_10770 [Polyangiaceae bacterium]|nr:hypothetical protein [Polyangiaceae bacterium]
MVDEDDAARLGIASRLWRWRTRSGKTLAYTLDLSTPVPREILLHHLILGVGKEQDVIHVNHDGLDNRRVNLRLASKAEVQWHARMRGNTRGVWLDADTERWRAQRVTIAGVHDLGTFDSQDDAAAAIDALFSDSAAPSFDANETPVARESEAVPADVPSEGLRREDEALPLRPNAHTEPGLSKRSVQHPKNASGYRGVTLDRTNNKYLVRADGRTERFASLRDAVAKANYRWTNRRQRIEQGRREPRKWPGEKTTQIGTWSLLTDEHVATWIFEDGPWTVRQRANGTVEVRRVRRAAGDPNSQYTSMGRYLAAAGPRESVEHINGDLLDFRVANLRIVPRALGRPRGPTMSGQDRSSAWRRTSSRARAHPLPDYDWDDEAADD